jgi:hypothetical protein
LLNAITEDQFAAALESMETVSAEFYQYFLDNWIPYKQSIAAMHRSEIRHLNNRTNNRIER